MELKTLLEHHKNTFMRLLRSDILYSDSSEVMHFRYSSQI